MPRNSEQLLISSVLRAGDYKTVLAASVGPDMFHSYAEEFQFITDYFSKYHKTPSKMAFKNRFPGFRIIQVDDTGHFANEVVKSHARFRLTSSMRDVTEHIAAGAIDKAVALMYSEIINISAEVGGSADIDIVSDFATLYEEAEAKVNKVRQGQVPGIPTGFDTLDDRTGGPQPGEFWIVGARLGEGKSWTMMRWGATALLHHKRVQYNTLEMSRSQVGYRMHSLLASRIGKKLFSNLALQQGKDFDLGEYRHFLTQLKSTVKGTMHITDGARGRISPLHVAAQIERNQPDVVFIDYITLMEGATGGDWKSIAQVTGELKQLAVQYQVPIIGAAQLNRALGLSRDPAGPEALAQADSIGQDADAVITIKKMSETVLAMRMAKYRHGPSNFKWYCAFDPANGVFEEVSYDKARDLKDLDDDALDAVNGPASPPAKIKGGRGV